MRITRLDIKSRNVINLNFLDNILVYSILLLPLALVTGPFLSDLIIVITSLIFIYFSFIEKKFIFYKNIYFFLFILICLFFLFTSLNSNDVKFSLESSLFYFRFGFFALCIWYIQLNYKNFSLFLFYSLLFTFFILCIDAIFQFYYGYNILGNRYDGHRLSGFFGEELKLGSFLSRLTPLLIALFIFNFDKISNKLIILFVITILLLFFVVFLSGERVSTAYIFLIYLVIILLSLKNLKLFLLILVCSSILFSSFIINSKAFNTFVYRNIISTIDQSNLINNPKSQLTNYNKLTDLENKEETKNLDNILESDFKENDSKINISTVSNLITKSFQNLSNLSFIDIYYKIKNSEIYIFSYSYHNIYLTSLKITKDNYLFGIGPKLFRKECKKEKYYKNFTYEFPGINSWDPSIYGCSTHPHNLYLHLITETGLIGIITISIIFLIVLFNFLKCYVKYFLEKDSINLYKLFLYLGLFITLFPFQPSGSFFNNWNSIIFYLPVGFILKEIYSLKDIKNE